jgi:hypothetical protein
MHTLAIDDFDDWLRAGTVLVHVCLATPLGYIKHIFRFLKFLSENNGRKDVFQQV